MSFDARSRERLEALGRQLPQKLPLPAPSSAPAGEPPSGPRAVDRRHPVETEQDPERLFRELMDVSADGSVPPHLLERLRMAEEPLQRRQIAPERLAGAEGARATGELTPTARLSNRSEPGGPASFKARSQPASREERQLYAEFMQLLLEDDESD